MSIFRCYALNGGGRILAADYIQGDDLPSAINEGWRFVASQPVRDEHAVGLEIWQGRNLLFSTFRSAC